MVSSVSFVAVAVNATIGVFTGGPLYVSVFTKRIYEGYK